MSGAPSSPPIVEAEGLHKVFRDFWHRPKVHAVNGVGFQIRKGEIFGLLGPNGSGKSTTIKMILGLLHPTGGRLRVLGQSPRDVRVKARIGYLPEESYLYPYLTSTETLDFFGRLFDLPAAERRTRTQQLLDMIGLGHAGHRRVGEFSKGMARRIGLAQALINDPDLVILDEPTAGLDPIGCRQVKDLIVTLAKRGKTILLSSHLLADVEDICDRVVILYNGRVRAEGTMAQLLDTQDRIRMTVPAPLPPESLARALAALREIVGQEPSVDHPRRDLERLFVDVIERARLETQEASGAGPSTPVAEYLARPSDPDELLRKLVEPPSSP